MSTLILILFIAGWFDNFMRVLEMIEFKSLPLLSIAFELLKKMISRKLPLILAILGMTGPIYLTPFCVFGNIE